MAKACKQTGIQHRFYRSKEIEKDIERRRGAYALLRRCQELSGKRDVPSILEWVDNIQADLNRSIRKARRFQAELLLAIGELGEEM